jgi:hypothetical protein
MKNPTRPKLAIAKAEKPDPHPIQVGFTMEERDRLDLVKDRTHALVTAALDLYNYGEEDGPVRDDFDTHGNPIGHLLEMAREYLDTINETFDAADARRKTNGDT